MIKAFGNGAKQTEPINLTFKNKHTGQRLQIQIRGCSYLKELVNKV